MSEHVDVALIGGGVIGLACAAAAARGGHTVCVLEKHPRAGMETSTHNSGVIHAGIYYPPGTLKAKLCVEGKARLYAFCEAQGVPFRRSGKLIIAADVSEIPPLEKLAATGRANGVDDLEMVDQAFVRTREPHVAALSALWSPSTGIVSAEGVVYALRRICDRHDVAWLPSTPLRGGGVSAAGRIELETERERISAAVVVNAGGLYADQVSDMLGGETFTIYPARGEYAQLAPDRSRLINGLVYPVPHMPGHSLGVHLVPSIDGPVLIGPTIRYQEGRADYESDRLPLEAFVEPTARILPGITIDDLRPGGSGIRAKLCPPTQPFVDFMIRADRRVPNMIHVAGIDSPGLTSCLSIGELAASLVLERL